MRVAEAVEMDEDAAATSGVRCPIDGGELTRIALPDPQRRPLGLRARRTVIGLRCEQGHTFRLDEVTHRPVEV
jgi:hypothetical protein